MVATARDLRFRTSEILSMVKHGKDVVITFRGKPAACLSPFKKPSAKKQGADLCGIFGMWKDHEKIDDVASHVRLLRKSRFE